MRFDGAELELQDPTFEGSFYVPRGRPAPTGDAPVTDARARGCFDRRGGVVAGVVTGVGNRLMSPLEPMRYAATIAPISNTSVTDVVRAADCVRNPFVELHECAVVTSHVVEEPYGDAFVFDRDRLVARSLRSSETCRGCREILWHAAFGQLTQHCMQAADRTAAPTSFRRESTCESDAARLPRRGSADGETHDRVVLLGRNASRRRRVLRWLISARFVPALSRIAGGARSA